MNKSTVFALLFISFVANVILLNVYAGLSQWVAVPLVIALAAIIGYDKERLRRRKWWEEQERRERNSK